MIGKQVILSAPFWKSEELGQELVFCQLTADPADSLNPTEEYRSRRTAIKAALGPQYFLDPKQPKKKAVAPRFHFQLAARMPASDT
jgi:hypothetical protein